MALSAGDEGSSIALPESVGDGDLRLLTEQPVAPNHGGGTVCQESEGGERGARCGQQPFRAVTCFASMMVLRSFGSTEAPLKKK